MENKENEMSILKQDFEPIKDNSVLEQRLKEILMKGADLMIRLISIQESVKFYKKFNFSVNEQYMKGYNKAFEIIEKIVFDKEEKEW